MNKRSIAAGLTAACSVMVMGNVVAGKPVDVVMWSNGFPSGPHFNLNIHGKKDGYNCDPASGGGSVFVPEYGDSEIDFVQNKRSSVTELTVHDKCATFDGDPALVQLPAGEYQVYARILAKPQKAGEPREVVFYPKLVEACNDTVSVLDTNGNGEIDLGDLDTDGDGLPDQDLDGNGVVDDADLALYLDMSCTFMDSAWVFDIADLVVYGWDYENNGSKLVQTRFYPVDTTTFE